MRENRFSLGIFREAIKSFAILTPFRRFGRRTDSSSDSSTPKLRELLRKKLEALNDHALKGDGEIPPEELASLERISRAVRLSDELAPAPNQWGPVSALVLALSLVSLLLLLRVPETEITMDVEASEVSFILPDEKPVLGRTGMAQLGVSGLDALRIVPDALPDFAETQHDRTATMMRLSVLPNSVPTGAISTATLIPPAGTRTWLRHMGLPRTYRLSLKAEQKGTNIALRADVRGLLEIAAPDLFKKVQNYDFGKSGGTVQFESHNDIMDVDFVLTDTSDLKFYAQTPIESLVLFRIEEFGTPQKSLVTPISTVLGGVLYFDSLSGEQYQLRTGEQIHFSSSNGRIESLQLRNDRISFKFRGRVAGMRVGQEEASRNLMPNLLQWLKARQPLSLLWGATIFVYGLFVSALGWYRRLP